MSERPQPIQLSAQGEQRRRQIGEDLRRRARARRTGRAAITGAACLSLFAAAGVLARIILSPQPAPATHPIAQNPTPPAPAPLPPETPAARIVIVSNEPITDHPCGAAPTSQAQVCILSDAQLLSALSTTGESYGLVRVGGPGGRTMVVSNSTAR